MLLMFLRGISILLFFSLSASYLLYKLYGSSWFFVLVPLLGVAPMGMMYLVRKYRKINTEIFLGHYLFYLNYILFGAILILIIALLMKLFSINLLEEIVKKRGVFQIGVLAILGVLAVYGSKNFKEVFYHNHQVEISDKETIKGLKIGFISDVHLNGMFDGRKLRKSFEKLKNDEVEIVLIGGDFLDFSYKSVTDNIKEIVEQYPFKHGIYLALGNHEYYGGIDGNIAYIEGLGIKILRDESVEIEGVTILGRDDRHNTKRKSLDELLENIDQSKPLVLVEHNPMGIKELKGKKVDLYLAGHTHRGQIAPFNLLVDYMYENSGGHKRIHETDTYVSTGLGTWMIPYRIGSRSEALILDLMNKEI